MEQTIRSSDDRILINISEISKSVAYAERSRVVRNSHRTSEFLEHENFSTSAGQIMFYFLQLRSV